MTDRAAGWQLADSTPEAYERYLVPAIFAPFAERLLEPAGLEPGSRVVDVACGTGIAARRAAGRVGTGGSVVGVDANGAMLDVARAASSGAESRITWLPADAAAIPLADGSADRVLCQQGLQFFPDPRAALGEMRRVLADGGRLALSVWRPIDVNPGFDLLAGVLERRAGPQVAAIMRTPFAGRQGEELRDLVAASGLRDVRVDIHIEAVRFPSAREFLVRQASASPLAGPVSALSADDREAVADDLAEALRARTDDRGVVFPMETWVVTAVR